MYSLGLINGKVYRNGQFSPLNIYIMGEIIDKIVSPEIKFPCLEEVDCSDKLILPGFIDPHVHINLDLGEFKTSDDYESASKAAAFGGITTFIDFLEPINHEEQFESKLNQKMEEAKKSYIDYSFHTTIGNFEGNSEKLIKKSHKNGIPSIKLFTTYSDSNRRCPYEKIRELIELSALSDTLILIHAENDEIILSSSNEDTIQKYEESRPAIAEINEIDFLSHIVSESGGRIYIVHVNCGSSIELLKEKYPQLLQNQILLESCPQYFYLNKEFYNREDGGLFLLAPPLRTTKEQELLKSNIDYVNTIGTDHAPFRRDEKLRYKKASKVPKGLGGIEYSFTLMYNLFGEKIIPKFTINPAVIHNLFPKKGIIQEGSDADLVVFDPKYENLIDSGHSKSDYSPYEGLRVKGKVESTILRGQVIIERSLFSSEAKGEFIKRS